MLLNFLTEVRCFLEPHWIKAHISWEEKTVPTLPSKHMCRYSCLFLKQILKNHDYGEWVIKLGRPASSLDLYGYKDKNNIWQDHAWLEQGNILIDLTADQFGSESIYLGEVSSMRYRANLTEQDLQNDLIKLQKRADTWIVLWNNRSK